jgi:hypothetical protein
MGSGDAGGWVGYGPVHQSPHRVVGNFERPQSTTEVRDAPLEAADHEVIHRDAVLRIRRVVWIERDTRSRLENGPDGDGRLAVEPDALQRDAGRGEKAAEPVEGPPPPNDGRTRLAEGIYVGNQRPFFWRPAMNR